MERQRIADISGKANKKPPSHKRIRKKRTPIFVASPKVPSSMGSGDSIGLNYNIKEVKLRVNPTERGICLLWLYFIIKIYYNSFLM